MGEKEGRLTSLSVGDYRTVLEFIASVLRSAGSTFPDATVSALLLEMLDADQVGAGDVDLVGDTSRRWADVPRAYPLGPQGFHEMVINHPLTLVYRTSHERTPLRLTDVADPRKVAIPGPPSDTITLPLALTRQKIITLAAMRTVRRFSLRQLTLARTLDPVLAEIYRLRIGVEEKRVHEAPFADQHIFLSARELAVLDLMADGLIARAIARQLAISARTVGKHIESIYRKLESHDRTSAVLRAQSLGLLHPGTRSPAGERRQR